MPKFWIPFIALLCFSIIGFSQQTTITGKVNGTDGEALTGATVYVDGNLKYADAVNEKGRYSFKVPAGKIYTVICSFVGYDTIRTKINADAPRIIHNFKLRSISVDVGFDVTIEQERPDNAIKIESDNIEVIAGPKQSVESLLKTLPGVTSNNELSSQYSVRGGNYDENLVYVNDFEIYRPQLLRSSQQEGLSFVNADMISSIFFSPGGFQSVYGDKMSSVLDVKYKRVAKRGLKVSAGLLDQSIYFQSPFMDQRLKLQVGARRQNNRNVLSGNDVQGAYRPLFVDVQGNLIYLISDQLEVSVLGYYADNKFKMEPESQQTRLGTVQNVQSFNVVFEGEEVSQFQNKMGGLSFKYFDEKHTTIKWLSSIYTSNESEKYDVLGGYYLSEVDENLGSDNFAENSGTIGAGMFHNWARNFLNILVMNTGLKASHVYDHHNIMWGVRFQNEQVNDEMLEWNRIDSAGYSLPFSNSSIDMNTYLKSSFNNNSNRYTAYLQDNIKWENDFGKFYWSLGGRYSYWNFTDEHLFSPRTQLSVIPKWKRDFRFRAATGVYYQPGFYREFRDLNGNINENLKAQRSIHYSLGMDVNFKMSGRPFKFGTEVYYKDMDYLVPYEVDNVKIRYYARNMARGYSTGLDLRLSGEFVPGIDSWVSLSFLDTREDIFNDQAYTFFNADGDTIYNTTFGDPDIASVDTTYPGFIPRPTDQRVTMSLFFQDYLPNNENFKVHLNLLFGSGYRYGPPDFERYKDVFKMPPYRRVDIGFSAELMDGSKEKYANTGWKGIKSIWTTLEVFNLLAVKNTVSYYWIKDISNRMYPVPNFLTSRQLNFRVIAKF